jgi:hypothetical protein
MLIIYLVFALFSSVIYTFLTVSKSSGSVPCFCIIAFVCRVAPTAGIRIRIRIRISFSVAPPVKCQVKSSQVYPENNRQTRRYKLERMV